MISGFLPNLRDIQYSENARSLIRVFTGMIPKRVPCLFALKSLKKNKSRILCSVYLSGYVTNYFTQTYVYISKFCDVDRKIIIKSSNIFGLV